MVRVSVLLPSYNHEAFIGEAVASVLSQTLRDFELVIVDDGSTDGSWSAIERFDDRRIVRHRQENRGAHAALEKARELASEASEYVAILNSDDVWDPRWLEAAVKALESRSEAGFCCALLRMIGPEQDERTAWRRDWYRDALRSYRESGDLEASLLHANFIMTTSNVVVRRDLFEATGGFRPLRYVHDLDFFLRLASASELALVEEELVTYRNHPANTIRETARDERQMIFEFGWILADHLERVIARTPDPEAMRARVLKLVCTLTMPAVASVALGILLPRWAAIARGDERLRLPPIDGVLRADHPARAALIARTLDVARIQVAEMDAALKEQRRAHEILVKTREKDLEALRRANDDRHALGAEIARLRRTRAVRIGDAIGSARGLAGAIRLPFRLLHIALSKRDVDGTRAG